MQTVYRNGWKVHSFGGLSEDFLIVEAEGSVRGVTKCGLGPGYMLYGERRHSMIICRKRPLFIFHPKFRVELEEFAWSACVVFFFCTSCVAFIRISSCVYAYARLMLRVEMIIKRNCNPWTNITSGKAKCLSAVA